MKICALWMFISIQCFADTKTLYIGLDADMSAVAQAGGTAIKRGAEIAIDEINQAGGVLGYKLALIVKDHRGNPARGITNINEFAKQENLVAILGGVHTPVVLKELPAIHQHKLIFLDPWAAGTNIVDNGFNPNYVFRVSVRDKEAGKVFIEHAKKLGLSKIGLLLERTGWGRSNEKSIKEYASISGLEILETQWFNWGQKSFDDELTALKKLNIEGIILVANAPEGAEITKSFISQNYPPDFPIISHWGISSGEFVELVGIDTLNKLTIAVLQTYSFESPFDPAKNNFVLSRYQSLFDQNINTKNIQGASGVAHAYDLIQLLALAIKQANTINRENIRDALENITSYKGLVKLYQPAFTKDKHDALLAEDYMMSRFDKNGQLTPIP